MATNVIFTKTLAAASANNIALVQAPGSAALILNGASVVAGVAIIDTYNATTNNAPGRRVIITSSGNDSGINWVVVGTNATGNIISDTFAGANAAIAISNLDFVTVTSITPSGAVAGTALAGTTAVLVGTIGSGSSPWLTWNFRGNPPFNLCIGVEISGTINFTVEYTYDDPNSLPPGIAFPLPWPLTALQSKLASTDALLSQPVVATRVTINSYTAPAFVRVRQLQAGMA